MDVDFLVFGVVGGVLGEGAERDQFGLGDVRDVPLILFADVEEEGVEVIGVDE